MSRTKRAALYTTCTTCGHATTQATGAELRALREASGSTLAHMASVVGVSEAFLSLVETGKRKPTVAVVQHYAALQEGSRTRATTG